MENIKLPTNNNNEDLNNQQDKGDVALISQELNESLGSVMGKEKISEIINDDEAKIQKARKFLELTALEEKNMEESQQYLDKIIKHDEIKVHKADNFTESNNENLEESDEDSLVADDLIADFSEDSPKKNESFFKKIIGLFKSKN